MTLAKQILLSRVNEPTNNEKPYRKLLVYGQESIEIIGLQEILTIQATGNYSQFLLKDGRQICASKTLKHYEDLLSTENFLRVHHSWLINTEEIIRIRKDNGYFLQLKNNLEIPVSRSRKQVLLDHLEMMYL